MSTRASSTRCPNRRSSSSNCSWWPAIERYFQIARCFRDEDLRADRQPEFTQLDLEMSFVDREDIMAPIEPLYTEIIETLGRKPILQKPFPVLTYADAMAKYGSDKPDLRFGMELRRPGRSRPGQRVLASSPTPWPPAGR